MLRLLIGLRILRGPTGTTARPGSGKRRVLLGICCMLTASAATHSGAGHAASPLSKANARASVAPRSQDPSPSLTVAETRRVLGHDEPGLPVGLP